MSYMTRAAPPSQVQRDAIVEAISARMAGRRPQGLGAEYASYRITDMMAARMGILSRGSTPDQILARAMSASDFPLLLADATNKVLLAAYQAAAPTYRAWSVQRNFNDFRPHSFLRASDFPALLPLREDGEIRQGVIAENREQVSLKTHGRILTLTRQAIVNDDLGAFSGLARSAARTAVRLENSVAYQVLNSNGGLGPTMSDGKAMFHADHGNLAGSAGVPSITTLSAARSAMRKQVDLEGNPINIAAKTILTGPDLETSVEQLVTSITPNEAGNVNPFAGRLSAAADASVTGSAWYVFADPTGDEANFAYGYLDGAQGPQVTTQQGFHTDGIAFRVVHDFGFGAIDYRFGFRNPGA